MIIAAELRWGDEAGDKAGNDLKEVNEQQLYGAEYDSVPYQRGRKRLRSPAPLSPQWDLELDSHCMPIIPSTAKKQIMRPSAEQQGMLPHPLAL